MSCRKQGLRTLETHCTAPSSKWILRHGLSNFVLRPVRAHICKRANNSKHKAYGMCKGWQVRSSLAKSGLHLRCSKLEQRAHVGSWAGRALADRFCLSRHAKILWNLSSSSHSGSGSSRLADGGDTTIKGHNSQKERQLHLLSKAGISAYAIASSQDLLLRSGEHPSAIAC